MELSLGPSLVRSLFKSYIFSKAFDKCHFPIWERYTYEEVIHSVFQQQHNVRQLVWELVFDLETEKNLQTAM